MSTVDLKAISEELSKGDWVQVLAPHEVEGKRGYVLGQKDSTRFRILIDEFRHHHPDASLLAPDSLPPVPAPIKIIKRESLQLIRKDGAEVMTEVRDFVDDEYACLGLIASTFKTSIIDPISAHGKLSRQSFKTLAGLPADLCEFKNDKAAHVVRSIDGGSFLGKWSHTFQPQDSTHLEHQWMLKMLNPVFKIEILVPTETDQSEMITAGTLLCFPQECDGGVVMRYYWDSDYFTPEQRSWMAMRVVHGLLRVTGCDIGCFSLFQFRFMFQQYEKLGRVQDCVDAAIICVDIMVQTNQSDLGRYIALRGLGFVLESINELRLAADLYEQAGNSYGTDDKKFLVDALYYQAMAFRRMQDFVQSEAHFVHCLRQVCGTYKKQAFAEEHLLCIAQEFPRMYTEQASLDGGDPSLIDLNFLLWAMMMAAGLLSPASPSDISLKCLLSRQYHEKAAARKALMQAFRTSSVEEFRDAVLSWKATEDELLEFDIFSDVDIEEQDLEMEPPEDADPCKDPLELTGTSTTLVLGCGNPDCAASVEDESKLLRCSRCQFEFYCSKTCQQAHWKEHKQFCKV